MAQLDYKKKHWLSIVSTGCSCQNRFSAVTKHDESRKEKQNTLEIRNTVVRKPKWIVEKNWKKCISFISILGTHNNQIIVTSRNTHALDQCGYFINSEIA